MVPSEMAASKSSFDGYLAIDFAVTSLKDMKINPQEIIEIAVQLVDAKTFTVSKEFTKYVKPLHRIKLTPYCVKVTGISQENVDAGRSFRPLFAEFMAWLAEIKIVGKRIIPVVLDHQLRAVLKEQCSLSSCVYPEFAKTWISLKSEYERIMGQPPPMDKGLDINEMLKALKLDCIGNEKYRNATDGVRNNIILLKYLSEKAKAPLWPSAGKPAAAVNPAKFDVFPEIEKDVFKTANEDQEDEDEDMDVDLQPDEGIAELLRQNPNFKEQTFRFLLVLDFEATCIKDQKIDPQEIIEIPVLKVDTRTMEPIGEFHTYVRPVKRPRLSPFCTKLTKIKQAQVDSSPDFPVAHENLLHWMKRNQCDNYEKCLFLTCGDWDLKTMLPAQMRECGFGDVTPIFKRWVNIKKVFKDETNFDFEANLNDLKQMMKALGLRHEGVLHSGRDDVRNITKVAKELARLADLTPTTSVP